MTEIFKADLTRAIAVVDELYYEASLVARKHDLMIRANKKPARHSWTMVLELNGDEEQYHKRFSIGLSHEYGPPGTAMIWSVVTDLRDGTWKQDIRKGVPLDQLKENAREVLKEMDAWITANEGLDPIEQARLRAGTDYYWSYESDSNDYMTYTADLPDGWLGSIEGTDYDFEGHIYDQKLTEPVFEASGSSSHDLIKKIEAEYARLRSAVAVS